MTDDDKRRPTMDELRQFHAPGKRKYFATPGTGPEGKTCRTCKYLAATGNTRNYYKCGRTAYTAGDATTIRVRTPACRGYEDQS